MITYHIIGETIMNTLNTAKTTVAKAVTDLNINTVFKGYKYTYGADMVKVVKINRKSNEVKVVSEVDGMSFIVRPHELKEVVMTENEKKVQEAYTALKKAEKVLQKADKQYRTEKEKSGAVLAKTYKDAVEKRFNALAAVDLAQREFVRCKFTESTYDRFAVQEVVEALNTNALEEFYKETMEMYTEVDKELAKKLSYVYGLIAIINIKNIGAALVDVDPASDYTKAYKMAMYNLRINMSQNDGNHFINVWHAVFGGFNKKRSFNPQLGFLYGQDIPALAAEYLDLEEEGDSDLVKLDTQGMDIQTFAGMTAKRIGLRDALRKIDYASQVVFTRVGEKDGNKKAQIARVMSTLQRVIGMHVANIALEGLRENELFHSVVNIGFNRNKMWDSAKVVLDPLCVLNDGEDAYTDEQKAIAEALRKEGFGVCMSAENYGKHGYLQQKSTYKKGTTNAFVFADGSSYEDPAKGAVRMAKQVLAKGEIVFPGVKTYVVSIVSENDLPSDVTFEDQEAVNKEAVRCFVAGTIVPSKALFAETGTGRFVTGKEADSSGQKAVVANPSKTMVRALEDIYFNAGGHNEKFAIAGLNSTKSTKFKFAEMQGWKMVKVSVKGKQGYLWVKETTETYTMTFSATANAFRAVDERLVGLEAALNSLGRATEELRSATATKLIYAKNGKTVYENIVELLAAGKIERKGYKVATNSQFNTGLEMQFGVDTASKVLEALVTSNKAIEFRKNFQNALALAEKSVQDSDVANVDAASIIGTIASGCAALGVPAEDVKGKVLHITIVKQVMSLFASQNKPWVRINFPSNKSVLIPVTQEFLDGFQETGRVGYVALEGMAAELFEAFAFHVQKASTVYDEEGIATHSVDFSEASIDLAIERICKARDNSAGKPLNKVPAYGTTLLLVTSAHLNGNEMYSAIAKEIRSIASKAYRQHVTCLYFKSPLLWNGSISSSELVDCVAKSDEDAEWLKQFGGDEDYEYVMDGTASYISPEKAVKNGNDADGDQNSIIFVPTKTLIGSKLENTNLFIDATKPSVAAGAYHYAKNWEKECEGLVLDTSKTLTLHSGDVYEADLEAALIRAAKEKANVAIFTSHQTSTLNNRGAYQSAFATALKRVANHPEFMQFNAWANGVMNDSFALEQVSEALWAFNADVQGSCVNFDAMDQVKSSEGRNVKKLASLLSSGELKFLNFQYAKANAPANTSFEAIASSVTKGIEQRSQEIYNTMFKPTAHNIAIEQLNHVLPAYTDANSHVVKKMIAYIMVVCGANVGYVSATKYDVCQTVAATAQKVNGRPQAANLETIADVQAEKGREVTEIECVQRTIATIARNFVGKVLV